ncbi:PREDICTED: uncharacterized protein LOC106898123 [Calidris pugnax]|uniref:uncharacterized protein LOC106898123 n=1 Tax=Calidris pugnax TaxID=198806 RepID=UPI00071CC1BB|nr:PREDICTED: uncharacterized protein LOC106898123 [Calidris pugnax]
MFNQSFSELRLQYNVAGKLPFNWNNTSDMFDEYDSWDDKLPIGPEPQEIDLADSLDASCCIYIGLRHWSGDEKEGRWVNESVPTSLTPIGDSTTWEDTWCQRLARNKSDSAPGTMLPRRLPKGFFLICGNRAWAGIPSNPQGGPCTIGQLSLGAPQHHPNSTHRYRFKRGLTQALQSTCNDDVALWSKWKIIFTSLFTPGVAAARAHKNIENLACWVVKQSNATSRVLSELSEDLSMVQHAVLQNRAAIDFLLLAHGHGCEDFDGMCCMDLSDHSRSIHKEIQDLIGHSQKVQQDTVFFGLDALGSWMGLSGWLKSVLQTGLLILIIIVIVLLCLSCVSSCIKTLFMRIINQVYIAQNKNGRIVGDWLAEKGQLVQQELNKHRIQLI